MLEVKISKIIEESKKNTDDEIHWFLENNIELLIDTCKDMDEDVIYDYIADLFQDDDYASEEGYLSELTNEVIEALYPIELDYSDDFYEEEPVPDEIILEEDDVVSSKELEYEKIVNQGNITIEILAEALYSINKRAKNYRDLERIGEGHRHSYYSKKNNLYELKEKVLSKFKPVAVHSYDIEKENYYGEKYTINLRFLFYEIGDYSFHNPVDFDEALKYTKNGLPLVKLEDFYTEGKSVDELLTLDFSTRVLNMFINNELNLL